MQNRRFWEGGSRDEIDDTAVGQEMAGGRGFFSLSEQNF
jgi:hypothetical protein